MDNGTQKNMQELLNFAIKHQNDGNNRVQIDEDKKIFLDQVLQSMSVADTDEITAAVRVLQLHSSSDEEKVDALDTVRDNIDNIDCANNFIKTEGAATVISCVKHGSRNVCIGAINVVAEMSQNNSICQQHFLEHGIIEELIKYLISEDSELIACALYALSALTQNFEPGLTEFIKKGGLEHLTNCLSVKSSRVFSKSCSLITSMSAEFSLVKDEFAKLDIFTKLTKKLRIVDSFEMEIEMALRTMSVLIGSRYCNPNEADKKYISGILKSIIENNGNLPECEEIVCYSNSILNHFNSKSEV